MRYHMFIWLKGQVTKSVGTLSLGHDCIKFDAYKSFGSESMMFPFCHVMLRDHIIKEKFDTATGSLPT